MKRLLLLLGILILPMQSTATPVLTRDLISAGGIDCSVGSVRICGSVGGYAFGASSAPSGILVIEGFWFPGLLFGSSVEEEAEVLTQYPFRLDQNFPNPCRRQTSIGYSVPGHGNERVPVHIEIFDVQGRQIVTLANAPLAPGQYSADWTGRDASGHPVSAGVYYCCLRAGGATAIKTLVVLK
jgi:hypothetical protein